MKLPSANSLPKPASGIVSKESGCKAKVNTRDTLVREEKPVIDIVRCVWRTTPRRTVSIHYVDGRAKAIQSGRVIIRREGKWSFRKPVRIESSPEAVKHIAPPISVALSREGENKSILVLYLFQRSYRLLLARSSCPIRLCALLLFFFFFSRTTERKSMIFFVPRSLEWYLFLFLCEWYHFRSLSTRMNKKIRKISLITLSFKVSLDSSDNFVLQSFEQYCSFLPELSIPPSLERYLPLFL